MKKLQNNHGETLIEVLAAVLISALSVTLLLSCVVFSSKNDTKAKAIDSSYYAGLSDADAQAAASIGIGIVTITREGVASAAAPTVAVYGGEGIYSYTGQ